MESILEAALYVNSPYGYAVVGGMAAYLIKALVVKLVYASPKEQIPNKAEEIVEKIAEHVETEKKEHITRCLKNFEHNMAHFQSANFVYPIFSTPEKDTEVRILPPRNGSAPFSTAHFSSRYIHKIDGKQIPCGQRRHTDGGFIGSCVLCDHRAKAEQKVKQAGLLLDTKIWLTTQILNLTRDEMYYYPALRLDGARPVACVLEVSETLHKRLVGLNAIHDHDLTSLERGCSFRISSRGVVSSINRQPIIAHWGDDTATTADAINGLGNILSSMPTMAHYESIMRDIGVPLLRDEAIKKILGYASDRDYEAAEVHRTTRKSYWDIIAIPESEIQARMKVHPKDSWCYVSSPWSQLPFSEDGGFEPSPNLPFAQIVKITGHDPKLGLPKSDNHVFDNRWLKKVSEVLPVGTPVKLKTMKVAGEYPWSMDHEHLVGKMLEVKGHFTDGKPVIGEIGVKLGKDSQGGAMWEEHTRLGVDPRWLEQQSQHSLKVAMNEMLVKVLPHGMRVEITDQWDNGKSPFVGKRGYIYAHNPMQIALEQGGFLTSDNFKMEWVKPISNIDVVKNNHPLQSYVEFVHGPHKGEFGIVCSYTEEGKVGIRLATHSESLVASPGDFRIADQVRVEKIIELVKRFPLGSKVEIKDGGQVGSICTVVKHDPLNGFPFLEGNPWTTDPYWLRPTDKNSVQENFPVGTKFVVMPEAKSHAGFTEKLYKYIGCELTVSGHTNPRKEHGTVSIQNGDSFLVSWIKKVEDLSLAERFPKGSWVKVLEKIEEPKLGSETHRVGITQEMRKLGGKHFKVRHQQTGPISGVPCVILEGDSDRHWHPSWLMPLNKLEEMNEKKWFPGDYVAAYGSSRTYVVGETVYWRTENGTCSHYPTKILETLGEQVKLAYLVLPSKKWRQFWTSSNALSYVPRPDFLPDLPNYADLNTWLQNSGHTAADWDDKPAMVDL